jgi:hypothetical protein
VKWSGCGDLNSGPPRSNGGDQHPASTGETRRCVARSGRRRSQVRRDRDSLRQIFSVLMVRLGHGDHLGREQFDDWGGVLQSAASEGELMIFLIVPAVAAASKLFKHGRKGGHSCETLAQDRHPSRQDGRACAVQRPEGDVGTGRQDRPPAQSATRYLASIHRRIRRAQRRISRLHPEFGCCLQ